MTPSLPLFEILNVPEFLVTSNAKWTCDDQCWDRAQSFVTLQRQKMHFLLRNSSNHMCASHVMMFSVSVKADPNWFISISLKSQLKTCMTNFFFFKLSHQAAFLLLWTVPLFNSHLLFVSGETHKHTETCTQRLGRLNTAGSSSILQLDRSQMTHPSPFPIRTNMGHHLPRPNNDRAFSNFPITLRYCSACACVVCVCVCVWVSAQANEEWVILQSH